ncbi:MAG: type II toxin-antitoxin system RelE/ParE family toxin [Bacteroidia bacterium]|nr:type II toxin-antitoxin system RelE/ParE family toxin [Bacteroidia bacterium]
MKKFSLKTSPDAVLDIEEICSWLNERKNGLGSNFRKELISLLNRLRELPDLSQNLGNGYRSAYLKKFPYTVVFKILRHNHSIEVVAVINQNRDPDFFAKRTR